MGTKKMKFKTVRYLKVTNGLVQQKSRDTVP